MHTKQFLALAIAMSCAGSAAAATSATYEITGKAVPAACSLTMSQSKLDLGDVSADTSGLVAAISRPMGTVNINCSSPAKLRISVTGTLASPAMDTLAFGGWAQGGKTIAGLRLIPSNTTVNNVAGTILFGPDGGPWGMLFGSNSLAPSTSSMRNSFGYPGSAPFAVQAVSTASFDITANFEKIGKADFSKGEITANQSLTFEITYI
ncbi:hypothetical protein [Pseudomonas sp. CAM1A]|uniref:hypothetical protein n=1 Tax=Pseudomonas sp. CAM1A TaxID=3231717 RepID=UPI0039C6A5FF